MDTQFRIKKMHHPPLAVVYHMCDMPGHIELGKTQFTRLLNSGLVDVATIYLSLNGNLVNFLDVVSMAQNYPNVKIVHSSETHTLMEYPSLQLVKDLCDESVETQYVLYFHMKGVSRGNSVNMSDWRKFMEYWTIDQWKLCVTRLDEGYDTVGTNYINVAFLGIDQHPANWPHYSGNFWWASSEYIKTLEPLPHPSSYGNVKTSKYTGYQITGTDYYRFDHEVWIGSKNPKWCEISSSPGGDRKSTRLNSSH